MAQNSSMLPLLQKLHEVYEQCDTLNIFQHGIQALNILNEQVANGGYIQLIQNGFGTYVFDNPWPQVFKQMGAERLAQNISDAKVWYLQEKDILERETTLQEFTALYTTFPALDALQEAYLSIINEEQERIKEFVTLNPTYFESENEDST